MSSRQQLEIERDRLQERFREQPEGRVFAPLADCFRKLGDLDEALRICLTGLARHPQYSSAHVILGKIHLERGDDGSAREAFGRVLELDAHNLLALRQLAELEESVGDFDAAEMRWTQVAAIEIDPAFAETRLEELAQKRAQEAPAAEDEPAAGDTPDRDADEEVESVLEPEDGGESFAAEASPEADSDADPVTDTPVDPVADPVAAAPSEPDFELSGSPVDTSDATSTDDETSIESNSEESSAEAVEAVDAQPVSAETAMVPFQDFQRSDDPSGESDEDEEHEPGQDEDRDPTAAADESAPSAVEEPIEALDEPAEVESPESSATEPEAVPDSAPSPVSADERPGLARTEDGVPTTEIATMTLAEIYAEQGFKSKALEIYRQIQRRNPDLDSLRERIGRLESEVDVEGSAARVVAKAPLVDRTAQASTKSSNSGSGDDHSQAERDIAQAIDVDVESLGASSSLSGFDLDPRPQPSPPLQAPTSPETEQAEEQQRYGHFRNWLDRIRVDESQD